MPKLQLPHRGHDIFSQDFLILDWVHLALNTLQVSSARVSKAANQSIPEPPPCFTVGRVFYSVYASFFLLQTYRWSTGPKSSSFVSSLHRTESQNLFGLFILFFANWRRLFLCFWVSSGVRLGVQAWSPSAFSMRLTVETETSVPAATKSCCRCFAVSQGFLTTCLLRTLVAATDSFLFLPHPGSVGTVPLILKLRTMLPTVFLGTFSAFAIFLYPFPCLFKAMISSLNILDNSLDLAMFLTCNETPPSTVQAIWGAVSQVHLMQLKPLIGCKFDLQMCALMRNSTQGVEYFWDCNNHQSIVI